MLDTNVWLDLFLPHRGGKDTADSLVAEASRQNASLCYPSQAILDVYQRVRSDNKAWFRRYRSLTQADALAIKRMAWDYVNMMQKSATAVPVDSADIHLACKFRDQHDDLEDDLILAACQRSKANYLVTRDEALLRHAPIEAHTPQEMLELLQTGRAKGTVVSRSVAGSSDWFYSWLEKYGSESEQAG